MIYGGFKKSIAKKTMEKEGIENKTAILATLSKNMKDGLIEGNDEDEENEVK